MDLSTPPRNSDTMIYQHHPGLQTHGSINTTQDYSHIDLSTPPRTPDSIEFVREPSNVWWRFIGRHNAAQLLR
jgi:hypothetical protein